MKKFFSVISILMIITAMLNINVYAAINPEVNVFLRVEGIENTIMQGDVTADSFITAIQKLSVQNNIEVVLRKNSSGQTLYSIGELVNNKFGNGDCWNGYIVRDNQMLEVGNLSNAAIAEGDQLVVYYGDISTTKKNTDIQVKYEKGLLSIIVSATTVTWIQEKDSWVAKTLYNRIKDANVHITVGNQKEQVIMTDIEGVAIFNMSEPNIYSYYIEGYKKNSIPNLVKVPTVIGVIGIKNTEVVQRAEAIALIYNYLNLKDTSETDKFLFSDVDSITPYTKHIQKAFNMDIILGDGNGNFRPEEYITVEEFLIMLSKACGYDGKTTISVDKTESEIDLEKQYEGCLTNASQWAKPYLIDCMKKGYIATQEYNWKENASKEFLVNLLLNID